MLLVDASAGVEVGTEQMWRFAEERGCPRVVVINKMDRENADFKSALQSVETVLGKKCAALQIPIGSQHSFIGVIDLLTGKAYIYEGTTGKFSESEIPGDLSDDVQRLRDALVERICETDDDLTMKYLEGEEIANNDLDAALRQGVCSGQVVPVLVASGLLNIGTAQLLDVLVRYSPSPI